MKFEKIYTVDKWIDWHETLSFSIDDFFATFSYYPNILEANDYTHSQFDFLTNEISDEREKVLKINDITNEIEDVSDNENIGLSAYTTDNASVEFAVDVNLNDREFRLIYDSEPDWGDDDVNVDSPIEEFEIVKQ